MTEVTIVTVKYLVVLIAYTTVGRAAKTKHSTNQHFISAENRLQDHKRFDSLDLVFVVATIVVLLGLRALGLPFLEG